MIVPVKITSGKVQNILTSENRKVPIIQACRNYKILPLSSTVTYKNRQIGRPHFPNKHIL